MYTMRQVAWALARAGWTADQFDDLADRIADAAAVAECEGEEGVYPSGPAGAGDRQAARDARLFGDLESALCAARRCVPPPPSKGGVA